MHACMQEKEVLYFTQLISESETPQKSISHHLDVMWYTLVPEVSIIIIITICYSYNYLHANYYVYRP